MSRAASTTALAGLATGDNTELFDLHIVKWQIFNLQFENLRGKICLKCKLRGYSKGHAPFMYALANMCSFMRSNRIFKREPVKGYLKGQKASRVLRS